MIDKKKQLLDIRRDAVETLEAIRRLSSRQTIMIARIDVWLEEMEKDD